MPFEATHHLKNSSTLLDLCILDDYGKLVGYGQHNVAFLSAHDLIHVSYEIKVEGPSLKKVMCHNFMNFMRRDSSRTSRIRTGTILYLLILLMTKLKFSTP